MSAAEFAQGLRDLAQWVEAHPDIPGRYQSDVTVSIYPEKDDRSTVAALARAMKPVEKEYGEGVAAIFKLTREFGPVTLQALFWRDNVCERIVTGSRTVTETVRDPDLLEAVPLVERIREEEIVEWRCEPVLALAEDAVHSVKA